MEMTAENGRDRQVFSLLPAERCGATLGDVALTGFLLAVVMFLSTISAQETMAHLDTQDDKPEPALVLACFEQRHYQQGGRMIKKGETSRDLYAGLNRK